MRKMKVRLVHDLQRTRDGVVVHVIGGAARQRFRPRG